MKYSAESMAQKSGVGRRSAWLRVVIAILAVSGALMFGAVGIYRLSVGGKPPHHRTFGEATTDDREDAPRASVLFSGDGICASLCAPGACCGRVRRSDV